MYKRKAKPDLMFLLTVFVCLGVLVTTTVSAADTTQKGWAVTLKSENACSQTIGAWQTCSAWRSSLSAAPVQQQRAVVSFAHEQHPALGLVWYYSQENAEKSSSFDNLPADSLATTRAEGFGVAVQQQYRHFGFSVGLESSNALPLNKEATLFLGVSNRW